ncbi:MAG: cytochrome c biogenesis protein CcdA [Clostridia bacterium]|nr:cytochrome c biogenesis protein CcdA [Clostridia bacterium]
MEYLLLFLEGIATFVSPCLLPMLPIYILYLVGKNADNKKLIFNSLAFVLGFTLVFIALGTIFSAIGVYLNDFTNIINIIFGVIIIIFGLDFAGVLKIPFLNRNTKIKKKEDSKGILSAFLFGIAFGIAWTPCVGAFLSSALLMVATTGNIIKGIAMLSMYCLGLGIPFILSAVLMEQLKNAFEFIKRNYKIFNIISAVFLIGIGIYMIVKGVIGI